MVRVTLRRVQRYFSPYWPIAIASIVTHSLFEIVDLLVPYATGQILNILSGQPLDGIANRLIAFTSQLLQQSPSRPLALGTLMGVIFVIAVVRSPLQPWISTWFYWGIPLKARSDRHSDAIAKILTLPLEFYDSHNPGRIASRIARGLENHTWTYPEIMGQLIPKLLRVTGIFTIMLVIDWRVAVPFSLSFLVALWLSLTKLRKIIRHEKQIDHYRENTDSFTSELITNIKTVKAFATEQREYERQQRRLSREAFAFVHRVHYGYTVLTSQLRGIIQSASFGILAFTVWATATGQISLGHFVTLMTIANMGYAELEPISLIAEVTARRYSSIERFHEFMETPVGLDRDTIAIVTPNASLNTSANASPTPAYAFQGEIRFNNVSFGYDPDRLILQNFNLVVKPRETLALVGRSGSGKSTLIKLLFRYFDPTSGTIEIDGQDIRTLNTAAYRRRLAIVHQEVDVFNGTVLDNLRYGNPKISNADVARACAIARVDEFLETLPQGDRTVVGERGLRLSGGQRQRLGIARALLVNPDVLVFDEATSSLDSESEQAIQRAMHEILGTRTTIAIAHRLSTIREADRIVVLDQGRIAEVGDHASLLQHGGVYSRLYRLQEQGELY
ncbi:MAG: ABC transporter ATP-binding protein [Coleofasciculaceae cyanobacterium RL_1_1]|nr:ABC transporter ATP-binding protein [Coleofasciculaceae cyanobacterium RL_1_1]